MKQKVLVSWSGGKDSALALYQIQQSKNYEAAALLTIINQDYDRISIHGVRTVLLEQQAQSIGVPLEKVFISKNSSNEDYEDKMRQCLTKYMSTGVGAVVFGDIFLEDLKKYREQNLSKVKMKAIFPIWKENTCELSNKFIDLGFKAVITCIDSKLLDKKFVGMNFDKDFLSKLPCDIDPCGENGEFHSFVYDGPIFKQSISHSFGQVVLREKRFYFCDLMCV